MDILSNVCIAWFCCSNHPFQTFLVSINGKFSWFWSTLLLYYSKILQTTLSLSRTGIEHVGISEFRHAYAYLSQVRIKCDILWRQVPLSTRLLVGYFTTHAFHLDTPYTRLPLLVSVPVCSLITNAKKVVKTPNRKPSHSAVTNTCLLFIYPHRDPFLPLYMGSSVGVLLTGYM